MRARGRNRTCDLLLRRQLLYPLSYSGRRSICGLDRSVARFVSETSVHQASNPQRLEGRCCVGCGDCTGVNDVAAPRLRPEPIGSALRADVRGLGVARKESQGVALIWSCFHSTDTSPNRSPTVDRKPSREILRSSMDRRSTAHPVRIRICCRCADSLHLGRHLGRRWSEPGASRVAWRGRSVASRPGRAVRPIVAVEGERKATRPRQ